MGYDNLTCRRIVRQSDSGPIGPNKVLVEFLNVCRSFLRLTIEMMEVTIAAEDVAFEAKLLAVETTEIFCQSTYLVRKPRLKMWQATRVLAKQCKDGI